MMPELSFDIIARRKWFQKPPALRLAVDQLEDAQRDLLRSTTTSRSSRLMIGPTSIPTTTMSGGAVLRNVNI